MACNSDLCLPYKDTLWPALTVNFGPKMVCWTHRDLQNNPGAQCRVASADPFDWKRGRHLQGPQGYRDATMAYGTISVHNDCS